MTMIKLPRRPVLTSLVAGTAALGLGLRLRTIGAQSMSDGPELG